MTRLPLSLLVVFLAIAPALAQSQVLVEFGSNTKYKTNSIDPGISPPLDWTERIFPNLWPTGTYGVGYNAGTLVQTPVTSGLNSIYTRAEFTIADASTVQTLFLGADYDDGYIAWINGVEVYRSIQMPSADVLPVPLWNTSAISHESSNAAPPDYGDLVNISSAGIPALVDGTNVLAVGVWNVSAPSSDLVVVPQLIRDLPGPVPRGPYLQMGTPDSVTIRWRTTALEDSLVEYGPSPDDLSSSVSDATPRMNHEITLPGLQAGTQYFYSVGSTTTVIAGGDADHFFRTAPLPATRQPIRVWVIGDSGTADANAEAVRDAYKTFTGSTPTDLWLMLGDNAYNIGTDDQYQAAVFDMYPEILRNAVVWPTIGNHDAVSASSGPPPLPPHGVYYDIFSMPAGAEAGGVSSGTEAYYSFDHGNIHFICLNSEDVDRTPTGDMLTWLEQDLSDTVFNTNQDWIVAYWHSPPYSKGSHDSDGTADSGGRLIDMRENALPILESWGVDLVLSGHSHSYERSFLLDGHYGFSSEIVTDPSLKLDDGDGRIDGDGAYEKASAGPAGNEGAVYVVAGSSGKLSGGPLNHPAMYISLNELGSLVLDVEGDRLHGTFVNSTGILADHFTIVKDTGVVPLADFSGAPLVGVAPLAVDFTDLSTTNSASWTWDLDGDSTADSAEQHPSFVYSSPGTYAVELTASNQSGSDVENKTAYICASAGIPVVIGNLAFAGDKTTLSWDADPAATSYDVVKGSASLLLSGGGDFSTAVTSCLEDGGGDLQATDGAPDPAAGDGYFYLVRGMSSCDEQGTFDSPGSAQSGSRDAGIEASPQRCP